MELTLRDYQRETVEKVVSLYKSNPHGAAKLVLATGLGKTIVFSSVAHLVRQFSNTNVLIIAHRDELLQQAAEKYRFIDPSAVIGKVGAGVFEWGAPVTVASIQTICRPNHLESLKRFGYGLVIVDECFPAGTLIDGRPIETIKVGDMVTAFDESTQTFTQKKVVRTFRNPAPSMLLKITSGSRTVVCTFNHPFYTSSGWKTAGQLTTGDMILHERDNSPLLGMRHDVYSFKVPESQLEQGQECIVQRGMQEHSFLYNHVQNQSKTRQCAHENQQSNEQAGYQRESAGIAQSDRTQTSEPEREWQRPNHSTADASRSIGLADGICSEDRPAASIGLSNQLQDRHCQSSAYGGNRSGRRIAHVAGQESTGSEKNTIPCWARVDSIEIYKSGSNRTFRNLCPDGYVYNFEVEDLHTYIANGFVVHNCHHVTSSNEYGKVLEALPNAFRVGVTATDMRLDKRSNTSIFGEAICSFGIRWAIRHGHLCGLRAKAIATDVTLDNIKTGKNSDGETDFQIGELAGAVDTPNRNRQIVNAYKVYADGRRAICFGVTIEHAKHITEAFLERGVPAATITGETDHIERKRLYKALADGSIKILSSVQVLTEGFDSPRVNCVIMARPTQSESLFIQMIGRGLRLAPGKEDCLLLDITDNCFNHKLEPQSLSKVLGIKIKDNESVTEAEQREEREQAETKAQVRKLNTKREKDLEVNLLEVFAWQERQDGMFVLEVGKEKHRIALVPNEDESYSVWARLFPGYEAQKWAESMPLDWAQDLAEKKAAMLRADPKSIALVDRNASWRQYPIDPDGKQAKFLDWKRIPWTPAMTKGEAADLIDDWKRKDEAKKTAQEARKARIAG